MDDCCVGEGYFSYLHRNRPNTNYGPVGNSSTRWDLHRETSGSHGEFIVDGDLKSAESQQHLSRITVPTLITVGDNVECAPSIFQSMHERIPGSNLVALPRNGQMTFADQLGMFLRTVDDFLRRGI